jgi:putative redox protein
MAKAHARIETTNFLTHITSGTHNVDADEPEALGGKGAGFAPYDLLVSSLGACTAITLRMYAERKQWPLTAVEVDLHLTKDGDLTKIARVLSLEGPLSDEQKARLADIAERTPVTLTLKNGAEITTTLKS